MKVLPALAPSPAVFWFDLGSTFAARLYLLFLMWDHKRKNTKKKNHQLRRLIDGHSLVRVPVIPLNTEGLNL